MKGQYKLICYLNGREVKRFFNVKSIHFDKKYNYWVLTECIYNHDIITVHRLCEFDKIVIIDKEGIRKELTL